MNDGNGSRKLKAIQTSYKGYKFRSRLEARWAVFFDALGVEWGYEVEGYDLGELGWYLPDFVINQGTAHETWIEIKPKGKPAALEISKIIALTDCFRADKPQWPASVLLFAGDPVAHTIYDGSFSGRHTVDKFTWCPRCGFYNVRGNCYDDGLYCAPCDLLAENKNFGINGEIPLDDKFYQGEVLFHKGAIICPDIADKYNGDYSFAGGIPEAEVAARSARFGKGGRG